MDSPLTQQARPETFEPKIVQLYQQLFSITTDQDVEDTFPPEGFWREFFLHKPEKQKLHDLLEPLTADQLVHLQHQTRFFFRRAIEEAGSGVSPRNENALENLTAFLSSVLGKRYTNPSTDVIDVLAGLDAIDKLVSDFVQGLEAIIRSSPKPSFRQKAIDAALAMVSGSYQMTLVTYFIHRDLFPALMKYALDETDSVGDELTLLGLLANYNKFESQNLYQNRLEDFVNEDTMVSIVTDIVRVCQTLREQYIQIQDDAPAAWTINSTLSFIGLRALTTDQKKAPPTEEEAKALFNALPSSEISTLLSVFSFVQANQMFTSHLISSASEKDTESPLSAFLSITSYLCHHAYRSTRATHYAELALFTIRVLLDDTVQITRLISADSKVAVRLARQRAPHLPHISSARVPATTILDLCTDTLSHNIRKRLSIPLYALALTILHRLITHLDATKTRLQHHWSYIWGSLLSLLRFLTQYANELTPLYAVRGQICTPLTSLLAFCLSRGDNFLPDPASYDDLFYKLIEATTVLTKFKEAYCPSPSASSTVPLTASAGIATTGSIPKPDQLTLATNALLSVTSHFQSLLSSNGRRTHQSPATVQTIIKEGYETLPDMQSAAAASSLADRASPAVVGRSGLGGGLLVIDFGYREKFRESEWKVEIKKIVKTVAEDGKNVALRAR